MSAVLNNLPYSQALNGAGLSPTLSFNRIGGEQFQAVVDDVVKVSPFYRDNLSVKGSYEEFDCWLSDDGQAGFAVSPDQELVNVFSLAKGHGRFLMAFVTNQYGALHLNCLSGNNLEKFYEAHGFEVARREPNWNAGEPDVVFMRRSVVSLTA